MPNGTSAEWHAIESLRRAQSETVRDVAVVQNETHELKEGQREMNDKLDDFKAEIIEAVNQARQDIDVRFNRQRNALIAIVGITTPVITALGTALIARGGS